MPIIEGLGERLREARVHAGVRQQPRRNVSQALMAKLVSEELARMGSDLTISQAAWSDYERDITPPSLAVIRAASRVSGVSEIYITYGVAMPPNNGQSTLIPPPPTVPPTAPLEEVAPRERAVTKRRGRAG